MGIAKPGYVLVKDSVPFLGKGVDDVLTVVRHVLTQFKYTQKLTLEIGKPVIFEHLVPEAEVPREVELTLHEQIRNRPMMEYHIEGDLTPWQHLWAMAGMVLGEGLRLSHLLVGDKFTFQDWLKIQIPVTSMIFFGVPVVPAPDVDDDVFLLAGSDDEGNVLFSVKTVIP